EHAPAESPIARRDPSFLSGERVTISVSSDPIPNVDSVVVDEIDRPVLHGDGHGEAVRQMTGLFQVVELVVPQ
ncbi:MAG: hypothetical protein KDA47_02895, partial [Planctomycetales bacterium]|nr:hypothetical protein [Planctomycetales bacterium]